MIRIKYSGEEKFDMNIMPRLHRAKQASNQAADLFKGDFPSIIIIWKARKMKIMNAAKCNKGKTGNHAIYQLLVSRSYAFNYYRIFSIIN
jgi:hypothetical protein